MTNFLLYQIIIIINLVIKLHNRRKYSSTTISRPNIQYLIRIIGYYYQEVFIDHNAEMGLRHETVWVEDSEDGDGGGQEDAEHPGENYSVENMVL